MPSDLDKSLVDGFSATAVILAFAAVLFAVRYPEIINDLLRSVDKTKPAVLADYQMKLQETQNARILPLLGFFSTFTLLMAPSTYNVVTAIDWIPSHFDYIRATWAFTNIVLFCFSIWTGTFLIRIRKKLKG